MTSRLLYCTVYAATQDLAATYRSCVFVQVHVDASPDAKDLFKNKLLGRATPAFYLFRGGRLLHSHADPSVVVLEQHLRDNLPVTEQPLRPLLQQKGAEQLQGEKGRLVGGAAAQAGDGSTTYTGFSMADLVYNIED